MLIPFAVLKSLAVFCDTSSSRYALGAIKLERRADGSCVAIATDGRRLSAYSWVEDRDNPLAIVEPAGVREDGSKVPPVYLAPVSGFECLLSADAIKTALGWKLDKKRIKARPALAQLFVDEHAYSADKPEALNISATDGLANYTASMAGVCGRFPKWRDVFPDFAADNSVAIMLDARYLAEVAAAAGALGTDEGHRGIYLQIPNRPEKPAIVRANLGAGQFAALVMPLATDRASGGSLSHFVSNMAGPHTAVKAPEPAPVAELEPVATEPDSEPADDTAPVGWNPSADAVNGWRIEHPLTGAKIGAA